MSFFDPFGDASAATPAPISSTDVSIANSLSIAIDCEEEDPPEVSQPPTFNPFGDSQVPPTSNFESFDFTFDNFTPSAPTDDSAFTFEVDSAPPAQSEEDILYEKFEALLGHACFEYTGKPLVEMFKQEDELDTIEAAYEFLVNPAPAQRRRS
jgi:hypothetical protein